MTHGAMRNGHVSRMLRRRGAWLLGVGVAASAPWGLACEKGSTVPAAESGDYASWRVTPPYAWDASAPEASAAEPPASAKPDPFAH
jgi:hypothetical protein